MKGVGVSHTQIGWENVPGKGNPNESSQAREPWTICVRERKHMCLSLVLYVFRVKILFEYLSDRVQKKI